ncbi:MAG: hypothetical protein WC048_17220 [Rhizobium sp.]
MLPGKTRFADPTGGGQGGPPSLDKGARTLAGTGRTTYMRRALMEA